MAFQTEDDWYKKLRTYVPTWFFEKEENQVAVLRGVAASLEALDQQADEEQKQLFVEFAQGPYLDARGEQLDISRKIQETDSLYRKRIRSLPNKSDLPSLKRLVDEVLYNGESEFIENYENDLFFNRNAFFNRGSVFVENIINVFVVFIPKQTRPNTQFFNRESYMSRADFYSSVRASDYIFLLIQEIIDENKALGTQYYLIER